MLKKGPQTRIPTSKDLFCVCSWVSVHLCPLSRRHPMRLIIALDDNNAASGELFWDDGESRGILEELAINLKLFTSPSETKIYLIQDSIARMSEFQIFYYCSTFVVIFLSELNVVTFYIEVPLVNNSYCFDWLNEQFISYSTFSSLLMLTFHC